MLLLTKLANDGLLSKHSADDNVVTWLRDAEVRTFVK